MELDPQLCDPKVQEVTYNLSKAVLRGFATELKNMAHVIEDPMKTLVYPLVSLVHDAGVIALKGLTYDPEWDTLNDIMERTSAKKGAIARMRERVEATKLSFEEFSTSSLEKQVELVSRGATCILVPGAILKSIKYVANYHTFGVFDKPALFHNLDCQGLCSLYDIKTLKVGDVRKLKDSSLLYVYTDANELLIAEAGYHRMLERGNTRTSYSIFHPELASMRPVYAAGEVYVRNGKITAINNQSGHYMPSGVPSDLVEKAFLKEGFKEAAGKYIEINSLLDDIGAIRDIGRPRFPFIPITDMSGKEEKISNLYMDEKGLPQATSNFLDEKENIVTYYPCAAQYALEEDDIKYMANNFSNSITDIDIENKETIIRCAHHLREFSEVGSKITQIALKCGGHKRTWNNVGKVFSGLTDVSNGIAAIASGNSLFSVAGGFAGVILGSMSIFSGLSGEKDEDAMEVMMKEISSMMMQLSQQIEEVYRNIMSALEVIHSSIIRIEEHILISVIPRLDSINHKLDRLESITCSSFKELHSQKFVSIIDTLRKDLLGEITLTNRDRKKYAHKLGTWIDCHSKSPLQTSLFRAAANEAQLCDIFSYNFDTYDILNLFLVNLTRICKLSSYTIPNITSFNIAVDLYISYLYKYNDNREILLRARETYLTMDKALREMQESNCHDILLRQYHHYRYLVGYQISKCRKEYHNEGKLADYLTPGVEYEKLLELLHIMEARRLMVNYIEKLLDMPITKLESRSDITSITNCRDKVTLNRDNGINYEFMQRAIYSGLDINNYNSWGQPIHYATKHSYDGKLLHLLLKTPDIEINRGTLCDEGDTWGFPNRPILCAMNLARYDMGILLCAQGHNISEYNPTVHYHSVDPTHSYSSYGPYFNNSDLGNSFGSCGLSYSTTSYKLNISITKLLNDSTSRFYRDHLRKAYVFYKQAEAGFFPEVNVSADCLMLLTCIVGDLYPLRYSKLTVDVNQPIEEHGLTYLMLAYFSNSQDVVKYLLEQGVVDNTIINDKDFRKNIPNKVVLHHGYKDLFRNNINRIDLVLSTATNKLDERLMLIIELLKEDIDNLIPTKRDQVLEYLNRLENNEDVVESLDALDTIYLLSNKKCNFGYCLSNKIDRYISSIS